MPLPTPLKIPPGAAPGLPGGSAAMGAMPSEGLAALAQLPGSAASQANKKQRELYVGNLPVGMVTPSALRDLFSQPRRLRQFSLFARRQEWPLRFVKKFGVNEA